MGIGDEVEVLHIAGVLPTYIQNAQIMIGETWIIEDFVKDSIALFTITNPDHKKYCVSIPTKNLRLVK